MGFEGTLATAGYCDENDTPHFKLLKANDHKLITLYGETPAWQSNGISFLGSLKSSAPLPNDFMMESAYPNPFNPTTTISFGLPKECNVEISIFDLRGQKIETLVNEFAQAGKYSINWDAAHIASGVYFVHFIASGENTMYVSQIQKLMLVK